MTSKQIAVGDPIEARCTKCRKITNHIVVAIVDAKPAKVECNTCRGQHLYRKKAAPKKIVREKPNPKLAEQQKWAEMQEQMAGEPVQEYSMDSEFRFMSLLKHPQFGLGQVQRVVGRRKIEVLFEDGLKMMCCK